MSDYSKINIRMSNKGLNIAHDPASLDFGQFTVLNNVWTEYEGQLTARRGFSVADNHAAGGAIIGIRKLNNAITGYSTYFMKGSDGKFYMSLTGVGGLLSTTIPFYIADTTASGLSSTYGSFVVERPSLSASAFMYVGDRTGMYKFSSNTGGGLIIKNVGITRPTSPPTFAVSAGGSLTASSSYNYRFTLYDKNTGTESLYNSTEATAASTTAPNKTITVTIPTLTVDSATTHVRVYRNGGTLSAWNRISDDSATYAYTGTTINFADTVSDLSIATSTLLDTLSDKPFSITQTDTTVVPAQPLAFLFGPYLGYVLGVGDGKNPGFLYWMNKYNPDSQNPANNIEVSSPQDPLQNGCIYNGLAYVFSKEAIYALYPGISESTFTPSKTGASRGLWAPTAFAVGPQIYYLSKDGIYSTAGGLEQALTDDELRPLFDPDVTATTINGIGCIDYTATSYMFMAFYKNELWFQYLGRDSNTWTLIFDVRYHRWRSLKGNFSIIGMRSMYVDEQTTANLLLGGNDGHVYQDGGFNDGGTAISSNVWSNLMTFGAPLIHKEFGSMYMDLDPKGATVTINAYKDRGATLIDNGSGYTAQTSSATRTRLPINLADTFSEDLQLNWSWASSTVAPTLYGYELLWRPEVTQLMRWVSIGVDHGILGWQLLRSAYITLRSDGTVNFNITYDTNPGATLSYSIASTSGGKKKIFVPFDPIKAKLFTYSITLGTATYFRFYPEESEVHVKQWISSFGYTAFNPFQGGSSSPDGGSIGQGGGGGGSSYGGGPPGVMAGGNIPNFDFSGMGGGTDIGPVDAPEPIDREPPEVTGTPETTGGSGNAPPSQGSGQLGF